MEINSKAFAIPIKIQLKGCYRMEINSKASQNRDSKCFRIYFHSIATLELYLNRDSKCFRIYFHSIATLEQYLKIKPVSIPFDP